MLFPIKFSKLCFLWHTYRFKFSRNFIEMSWASLSYSLHKRIKSTNLECFQLADPLNQFDLVQVILKADYVGKVSGYLSFFISYWRNIQLNVVGTKIQVTHFNARSRVVGIVYFDGNWYFGIEEYNTGNTDKIPVLTMFLVFIKALILRILMFKTNKLFEKFNILRNISK